MESRYHLSGPRNKICFCEALDGLHPTPHPSPIEHGAHTQSIGNPLFISLYNTMHTQSIGNLLFIFLLTMHQVWTLLLPVPPTRSCGYPAPDPVLLHQAICVEATCPVFFPSIPPHSNPLPQFTSWNVDLILWVLCSEFVSGSLSISKARDLDWLMIKISGIHWARTFLLYPWNTHSENS